MFFGKVIRLKGSAGERRPRGVLLTGRKFALFVIFVGLSFSDWRLLGMRGFEKVRTWGLDNRTYDPTHSAAN